MRPILNPSDGIPAPILAPQNFWGALQSQGAPNIQGDAYMTYYDTRTGLTNDDYRAGQLLPVRGRVPARLVRAARSGSSTPASATSTPTQGTGEYYTLGGANGSSAYNPVSTFYDV